jgi:uncharacterized protein with HEPN domain
MNNNLKKFYYDIKVSVDSIKDYLKSCNDYENFKSNKIIKRAVEREFEIIGEAINSIQKIDKDVKISDYRKIINFRNYLIHGYSDISDKIVWSIIESDLPVLENEINDILSK